MGFKSNRSGKSAILSHQQFKQLNEYLPEKYSLLAEVMLWGCGRVKECSTIKVRNINFTESTIVLEKATTKMKESRVATIHTSTIHKLKNWIIKHQLRQDDYIFFSASNNSKYRKGEKHLGFHTIEEYFKKGFDWIGIKGASTHSFRRSMATHLLNSGFTLKEIMDVTGHKNIATLQEYLDTDKSNTHKKYKQLISGVMI